MGLRWLAQGRRQRKLRHTGARNRQQATGNVLRRAPTAARSVIQQARVKLRPVLVRA